MKKTITGRLKETPTATMQFDIDFSQNWLVGATFIEDAKRKLFAMLKDELHTKISLLTLEDVEFKELK